MRKTAVALVLLISLLLSAAASADVLTAMPVELDPERLEKTTCNARIVGYNEAQNTLTVHLTVPEIFPTDELYKISVGDSIYTGGQEILIESISHDDDWCGVVGFNDWEIFFFEERDGCYRMADEDCYFWNVIAVIECPVKDHLLLLDYVDDDTGDMLNLPAVLTARELTVKMLAEQASDRYHIGFAADNVTVTFDGEGNLAVINRFYVPWQ